MRRIIRLLLSRASLLLLLAIHSCDTFKDDAIQPENLITLSQTEYYVLTGSSVIIDLESIVKQSFADVSLKFSQNSLRGTLSQLGTLLKYTPAHEFLEGEDLFNISVVSNNEVIATETITIFMKQKVEDLPCPLYAMEDKVYVRSGSTVSVGFLKNDRICEVNDSPLQISIHLNPRFGECKLVGDSIVYTTGAGYTGHDELVYKLSDSSGKKFSYGIITISEWKVQVFPTPITPLTSLIGYRDPEVNKMFFVNDSTGFLGGYTIYKTTDGGATWRESSIVVGAYDDINNLIDDNLFITDIYFLDANHGYATYSGDHLGVLLYTMDGGDTWSDVFQLDRQVTSVFFTSSTTGFVCTGKLVRNQFNDPRVFQTILKSDDGGITWNSLFSNSVGFGTLHIRFGDSKNGYAYDNYSMLRSIDGGETWKFSLYEAYIKSVAVTPENIISANLLGGWSETSSSVMVRSQDGETWAATVNFPYAILAQGFSPNSSIGFAVGIGAIDFSSEFPRSQRLSISKTLDIGATWSELEITEALYGHPYAVAFPSDKVAYVLGFREVIKFTRP